MSLDGRSVLLLLSLLLASCAPPGSDTADPTAESVLLRGNGGEPGSLDPALAEDIHAFNILVDTFEGLVAENASGELIAGVARAWSTSDDGTVYIFELREDARWSNGQRVTAADFVRSLRRVASPDTASAYAYLLTTIKGFGEVASGDGPASSLRVRAIDDLTLEIVLENPASHFLALLALPLCSPIHESLDPRISNGAYMIAERRPDDHIRLRKNPFYWDARSVAFDEVLYYPIVEPLAEFNAFRTGALDITHNIPTESFADVRDRFSDSVRVAPSSALYYIAFDLTEPPFDDVRLRMALNLATDRKQIVKLLGRGEEPAYGVVPEGIADYTGARFDWADEPQARRDELARTMYASAGFSDQTPLTIRFLYDAGGVHERIALALSSMWRDKLGVDIELEKREWGYFLDSRDIREDWDVMRFSWFGDYNSPLTFLEIFASGSEQNLPRYASTAFDSSLNLAVRKTDRLDANAQMRAAEKLLLDDYAIIPVYFFVSKHLVRPEIGGFEANAMDRHPSRFLIRAPATGD